MHHHKHVHVPVNQLLLMKTLSCNLPEIKWTATIIHNKDLDYLDNNIPETLNDLFTVRNILDDQALVNLVIFSPTQIKNGLQYPYELL